MISVANKYRVGITELGVTLPVMPTRLMCPYDAANLGLFLIKHAIHKGIGKHDIFHAYMEIDGSMMLIIPSNSPSTSLGENNARVMQLLLDSNGGLQK